MVQIDRRVYGAAIGDIIGSSYERKRDRIKTTKFDLFTERSQFTDDTVLTAAIAQWLMESPDDIFQKCIGYLDDYIKNIMERFALFMVKRDDSQYTIC